MAIIRIPVRYTKYTYQESQLSEENYYLLKKYGENYIRSIIENEESYFKENQPNLKFIPILIFSIFIIFIISLFINPFEVISLFFVFVLIVAPLSLMGYSSNSTKHSFSEYISDLEDDYKNKLNQVNNTSNYDEYLKKYFPLDHSRLRIKNANAFWEDEKRKHLENRAQIQKVKSKKKK